MNRWGLAGCLTLEALRRRISRPALITGAWNHDYRTVSIRDYEILVNFDPGRTTAAIETLVQLSERFQIIYFTCHPETADKFHKIDPVIPAFQLTDGGFMA